MGKKYHNMISVNGQLGRDPELKTSQNGKTYLQNCIYEYIGKDESGESKYQWWDFVAFGSEAETIAEYSYHRGKITIWGPVEIATYTDRNGVEKQKNKITVKMVDIFDFKKPKAEAPAAEYVPQGFTEIADDIPF